MPLLGLIGWPLTQISPVLTFNFFILLGPVLATFMAWLLCLRITQHKPAAIIGGFLFAFSSYEMGQDPATLNLRFTICVPALLLFVLLRLDNRLSRLATILLGALTLICQFLICIEIFGMRLFDRFRRVFVKTRKASGAGMLPYPLTRGFAAIFGAERFLLGRMNLPIGLSLLAIAQAEPGFSSALGPDSKSLFGFAGGQPSPAPKIGPNPIWRYHPPAGS